MKPAPNIDAESSAHGAHFDLIRLITPERLKSIREHAMSEYPAECCGMIQASGRVRRCKNAQDQLHQLDPIGFPRTSQTAYCFDAEDQLFLARSHETNDPVRILYHSHPDAPPEFSEADRRGATVNRSPLYPGLGYLVVECRRNIAGSARLYIYVDGGFQCAQTWEETSS
jgi:[CysO sulfur-carrier protein]-S-L-cysteine hydrolase